MTIEPLGSIISMQHPTVKAPAAEVITNTSPQIIINEVKPVAKKEKKDISTRDERNIEQDNVRIRKAVEQINQKFGSTEALFGIHEGTNRVTIKIIDKVTKEVIKELPPEKTLDMIEKVWELAGMIVDERR